MKYYEIIFEGHYEFIDGFLSGVVAAKGKDWKFFFSEDANIKTETLAEIFKEWISLKEKVHHIIIDEKLHDAILEIMNDTDIPYINKQHVKSIKEIKTASFTFEAKTYGRKYGEEIKNMTDNLASGLTLSDYNPKEIIDNELKGPELYAPGHEYEFTASGRISGDFLQLVECNKKMNEYQLIEVSKIVLGF